MLQVGAVRQLATDPLRGPTRRRLIWFYAIATAATYWVVLHHRSANDGSEAEIFWIALDAYLVRRMLCGSHRATTLSLLLCVCGLALLASTFVSSTSLQHRDAVAPLALAQTALLAPVWLSDIRIQSRRAR